MQRLRKFLELAPAERFLLLRAMLLLAAIRLGLLLVSFQALRRVLLGLARAPASARRSAGFSPERIAWAATVAGRWVPGGGTCLAEALAVRTLLEREGYPARLHIGVAKNDGKLFRAHAWVESQGKVVIGGAALDAYTPLLALGGEEP